jgi:hypothetical protein
MLKRQLVIRRTSDFSQKIQYSITNLQGLQEAHQHMSTCYKCRPKYHILLHFLHGLTHCMHAIFVKARGYYVFGHAPSSGYLKAFLIYWGGLCGLTNGDKTLLNIAPIRNQPDTDPKTLTARTAHHLTTKFVKTRFDGKRMYGMTQYHAKMPPATRIGLADAHLKSKFCCTA